MKQFLYILLTTLLALPGMAYGQVMTDPPVINIIEEPDYVTIEVIGNGMLNVQLMRDHWDNNFDTVIDEAQVVGFYEYTINRVFEDGYNVMVTATAQEDGEEPSYVANASFLMKPFYLMPKPEISFVEDDYGVTINITNGGPDMKVYLSVCGETIVDTQVAFSATYYVERTYEEQEITVEATNFGTAPYDIDNGDVQYYVLAPKVLPVADAPPLEVYTDEGCVIVTAYPVIEDQIAHLLLNGEEVDNPYYAARTDDDYVLEFFAYCDGPNVTDSEWIHYDVFVPARVEVIEPPTTTAPTIDFEILNGGTAAKIVMEYKDYEPGDIFYRYGLYDETTGYYGSYTSWKTYEGEFLISSPGKYVVEAYAEAYYPDYKPSRMVSVEFELVAPTEPTSPPTFTMNYMEEEETVIVEIIPTEEGSMIYYRPGFGDENGDFNYGDWAEYEAQLCFSGVGRYRIDAYAVAVGHAPSQQVTYEFTITPFTPSQSYDFEENGVFYIITTEERVSVCSETTGYNTYSGVVTIPTTVTHDGVNYMVNGIADNAFRDCVGLTGVNIGAYVTTIGNNAFMGCTSLTSVTLGDYVTRVGEKAFANCTALADVKMGSGMRYIEERAFQSCNALTSVTCKAATPPYLSHRGCFDCYNRATLYVYPAVLDSYRSTSNFWSQFSTIVAEDKVAPVAGDANGDGSLNISDVTTLINMLLQGH